MSQHPRTRTAALAICTIIAVAALTGSAEARTLHYDFVVSETTSGPQDILVGAFGGADWPVGTVFPIEARELGGGQLELTIRNFFLPDVPGPFNQRVRFEVLDEALNPTDVIQIGAEVGPTGNWAINPAMSEPMIHVRMMGGSHEHIVQLPLTTSLMATEPCPTYEGVIGGSDMQAVTGDMTLVGATCVQDSFLPELSTPFYVNIEGVMAAPEPSAASLGVAAVFVVGLVRRQRKR